MSMGYHENAAAGAVNAGQAEDAHPVVQRLPGRVRLRPRAAPPAADGCAFVHPGAAHITINAR